jgi:hypothetical protein
MTPARKANSVLKKKGSKIKLEKESEYIKVVGKQVDQGNNIVSPLTRKA